MISPSALRYFLAVATHGSFRGAADALRIAASAVGRQVTQLELELGAKLFERKRGRNGLQLTAAGEVLFHHARTAAHELERAYQKIEDLKGLRGGNVSIGVPETFARDFFPQFLAEFNQKMPHISFDVVVDTSPKLIERLLQDEVELAFVYNPSEREGVQATTSLERRTYMMMRADHPLASRAVIRISDCAQYPVIMPAPNTSMRELHDRAFAKAQFKPRVVLTTTSYEMIRSSARVGLGLALVNDYLMDLERQNQGSVVFVPVLDSQVKPQQLVCCVRRARHLSLAATALMEEVQHAFRAIASASSSTRQK